MDLRPGDAIDQWATQIGTDFGEPVDGIGDQSLRGMVGGLEPGQPLVRDQNLPLLDVSRANPLPMDQWCLVTGSDQCARQDLRRSVAELAKSRGRRESANQIPRKYGLLFANIPVSGL